METTQGPKIDDLIIRVDPARDGVCALNRWKDTGEELLRPDIASKGRACELARTIDAGAQIWIANVGDAFAQLWEDDLAPLSGHLPLKRAEPRVLSRSQDSFESPALCAVLPASPRLKTPFA